MEEIEEEPVYPCPECMSVNVRDTDVDDNTSADYICNECGCKFDAGTLHELTRIGRIAENVCNILAVTFVILATICLVGGGVVAAYVDSKNGGDLPHPSSWNWAYIWRDPCNNRRRVYNNGKNNGV